MVSVPFASERVGDSGVDMEMHSAERLATNMNHLAFPKGISRRGRQQTEAQIEGSCPFWPVNFVLINMDLLLGLEMNFTHTVVISALLELVLPRR